MLSTNYGDLVPEDELLTHQIVDTFATVSQSDPSWTEKIWTIAHARDNSLAGRAGRRQVHQPRCLRRRRRSLPRHRAVDRPCRPTVVRRIRPSTTVGPIHYEVVEPLKAIRISLDRVRARADRVRRGDARANFPPALEDPWPDRSPDGYRVTHNVLRYRQIGVASGWVEVEGERTEFAPQEWISIRDHSWGLRPGVGKPIPGLPRRGRHRIDQMFMTWLPMTLTRPDGSTYSLFVFYQEERGDGYSQIRCQAEQQNADGSAHRFVSVEQKLSFRDDNRRLTGGTITLIDSDGSKRPITVTAAGPTGFHLGTAGYYGWNDWVYGEWVGELRVEGSHVTDCDTPENARKLHQLRDLLVRVEDPVGGGVGLGNAETFALGEIPELGLTAENSFL